MKLLIPLAAAAILGGGAVAEAVLAQDMAGMTMPPGATVLHETGQSEFAAIAEATRALEADPTTDWSKVNIDALRQHLVDMDNVTVRSVVRTTGIPNGARFAVTSPDPGVEKSIRAMVRLHAQMANQEGPYKLVADDIAGGANLTVTGSSPADEAKIRGLGFFGLLTEGVHHQLHHLMLAKGEQMHH